MGTWTAVGNGTEQVEDSLEQLWILEKQKENNMGSLLSVLERGAEST